MCNIWLFQVACKFYLDCSDKLGLGCLFGQTPIWSGVLIWGVYCLGDAHSTMAFEDIFIKKEL